MASLTAQQQEAVQHDGHLLVVAGPGSGKTATSVAKATRILRDPARSLVMVTFTKEAAEEMRKRVAVALARAQLAVPSEERLLLGTFHSIAIRHLKRHGLRSKVLGPAQQDILYRDAAFSVGVDKSDWAEVQNDFERIMYSVDQQAAKVSDIARSVYARYRSMVTATGQVDLYSVMRDCALRAHRGDIPPLPYTDMLVDEGQDIDDLQRHWIFAHANAGSVVTIVGDDDQSIYEWRNALGYEGMRSFLEKYRAHRVELGDNFRCRAEILTAASRLIGLNEKRLGKKLVARRGTGGAICAVQAPSSDGQNELLAELMKTTPEQHRDAAVLARTNRSLDRLEIALKASQVPYSRLGRSIWDQPVIAGYVGLLQTLLDATPAGLLPIMQLRRVSDGARSDLVHALGSDASSFLDGELPASVSWESTDEPILKELARSFCYWRRQLRPGDNGLGGSVREVILEVGEQYAAATKSDHNKDLVSLCSRILADLRGTLSARLRLVSKKDRSPEKAPVILMSMHGAKGLEFETVHAIDVNDGDDGAKVRPEAERRLMYVALTRAKNCCVVWTTGRPHPSLAEAAIVAKHGQDALVETVRSAR